jgi:hypothetical protein
VQQCTGRFAFNASYSVQRLSNQEWYETVDYRATELQELPGVEQVEP